MKVRKIINYLEIHKIALGNTSEKNIKIEKLTILSLQGNKTSHKNLEKLVKYKLNKNCLIMLFAWYKGNLAPLPEKL